MQGFNKLAVHIFIHPQVIKVKCDKIAWCSCTGFQDCFLQVIKAFHKSIMILTSNELIN